MLPFPMASLFSPPPLVPSRNITTIGQRKALSLGFCHFGLTRRLRFLSPKVVHLMQIKDDSCTSRLVRTQSVNSNDSAVTCEALCKINWSIEIQLAYGCIVYLTGDTVELGSWNPDSSIRFSPSVANNNIWEAQIEVPCGMHFQYNYVIKSGRNIWSDFYRKGPKLSLSTPASSEGNKEIHVRDCWLHNLKDRIRVPSWDSWLFDLTVIQEPFLHKKESAYPALFSVFAGEQDINSSEVRPFSIIKSKNKSIGTKEKTSKEDQWNGKFPSFLSTDFKETGTEEKIDARKLPDLDSLFSNVVNKETGTEEKSSSLGLPKALSNLFSKEETGTKEAGTKEKAISINGMDIKATATKSNLFSKKKDVDKETGTKERSSSSEPPKFANILFSKKKPVSINGTDIKATSTKEKLKKKNTEIEAVFIEEKLSIKNQPIEEPWYQTLVHLIQIEESKKGKKIAPESDKIQEIPKIITKILISSLACNMRRIAVLENEKLVELYMEPLNDDVLCNNIYLGVIKKMATQKGGAFVDLGLSEPVFMSLENYWEPFAYDLKRAKTEISTNGGENREKLAHLGKGSKIIVQVTSTDMVTLCPYPTITSRFWILKTRDDKIEVSKSIESSEKKRLFSIAEKLKPNGFGLEVQLAAAGQPFEELERDLHILLSSWNKIVQNAESAVRAAKEGVEGAIPAMLYRALDHNLSVIYDYFPDKVESVLVDSPRSYHEVTVGLQKHAPELCKRVELYNKSTPIFYRYKIEEQIDKILCKTVLLPGGGSLVIEQTEAFVSVDVNSGRSMTEKPTSRVKGRSTTERPNSRAKTSLKVNLSAAKQIARELRLRDIRGVIIVDFIDMSKESNKRLLYEEMKREVERDRAKVTISKISSLGLMQITREKIHRTNSFMISEPCECCHATGRVEALETCFSKIEREISRFVAASYQNINRKEPKTFELKVGSDMCEHLTSGKKTRLDILSRSLKVRIHLKIERGFSRGKFELTPLGDESKSKKQNTSECEES